MGKEELAVNCSRLDISLIIIVLAVTYVQGQVPAPADTFADRVAKNRYAIEVKNGRLSGEGAAVLESALADAQFVLLGEDHGIAQIPEFDAAVCSVLGPRGFHDLAVEVGPSAAEELSKWLPLKDGNSQVAVFDKQFPETIAFYNWSEEYEFLSHCAASATGGSFQLWGLDQELMGASRFLLSQIVEQHLSEAAAAEGRHLLEENDRAHHRAEASGDPFELFMLSAQQPELAHFRQTLSHEGNPALPRTLDGLIESREIYKKFQDGRGYESNRQRALLMKKNFMEHYGTASTSDGRPPKVILKFGGEHGFKGFNPLHNNDLGNMIAELSDYQQATSVHILLLGVKGQQLRFAGIGRPPQPGQFNLAEDKDSDFLYLKPFFERTSKEGLTLFDLRSFRKGFGSLGNQDREMERLVFGYDFLVLVANATPAKPIQ